METERLLRTALETLGCDDKEINMYLACYTKGAAGMGDLMKRAKLQRSTAYGVVKSLVEKGLFAEDNKAYGRTYTAVEPDTLMRLVGARQRQIGQQHLLLEEHLGELQALYRTNEVRPKVRTYQGVSGLTHVWRDVLTARGEILLWTNQATESRFFSAEQHEQFVRQRVDSSHFARVLTVNNPAGRRLHAEDVESLRETRFVAHGVEFSTETYIYDHKVAMLDYNQDIIGVIIESPHISGAQRAMFEATWQGLKGQSSGLLDKWYK